jgi:putative aminotransferase
LRVVSTCLLAEIRNTGLLVALAAQKAGGECQVVPVAPGEDEADVLDRARKVEGDKPVIIVREIDGELRARLFDSESN